jgi:membrane carboxypeptidase/penicillin-binding protein PbpC
MHIRLRTRVEVDGARFWFGSADAELIVASSGLQAAAPIILTVAMDGDLNATNDMTAEEIAEKVGEVEITEDMIPAAAQEAFCRLFSAAVVEWEGVVDEDGEPVECLADTVAAFPTEKKVKVVCEYFNERGRLVVKERTLGEQGTN